MAKGKANADNLTQRDRDKGAAPLLRIAQEFEKPEIREEFNRWLAAREKKGEPAHA